MSKINFSPALFLTFIIATLLNHSNLHSQPWLAPTEDGANFFEIQESFNNYWEGKTIEKGKGFKVFKRWEHYWENRVNPDGTFPSPDVMMAGLEEYNQLLNASAGKGNSMAAWTAMGPTTTGGGYAGLGRINAIAFHPTNSSIIWVGSPSGGLWKTTDGGATWSTGYDNFSVLGVSSILITPSNPNIMYVATGDGDAGDTRSIGVYKSTDGGATWAATGLTFTLANYVLIRKLLMDPNDEAHILAAASNGLYRTTNSGTSWTKVVNANFYDVEAQSGATANNFYACTGSGLYRSTNNGLNWTLVQTISGSGPIAIGYSPADTTAVVALCSKSSDSGFLGFYRSTNSGASYTLQTNNPNLLGWAADGSDSGGQGWYDLVVAVDPTNASIVYTGGVNVWKSTDAGLTWTIKATWNGAGGVQTVHADHHAMEWQNNTTLFDGNDGGIYKTVNGGTNWTHHTNGMQISQLYRLGVSQTTNAVIAGLQDNGTKLRSAGGTWTDEIGGDGMECAIDYSNAQYMYGELYYGDFFRSSNGGTSWSDLNPGGQDGTGAWVTPYIISSNNPATLYIGYNDVYKTTDRGNTWTAISTNLSSSDLTVLADAPSDANVLYAGRSSALYRTINGGTNWASMTIPAGAGSLTYLCVSPSDANVIYATMSNYTAGSKVYKSTNGGASWTNISGTLPNVPANCIIYQKGSPEGLYVGMDVGVYYRDNITNAWALVGTGFPNVIVEELEIKYDTGKLRAATYGRGLWETDINCVSPVVNAPTVTQPTCTVNTGTIVVNATGNGTLEYSVNGGTSWQTSNTFSNLATGNYNIRVRLQVSPTCFTSYSGNPVVIVAPTPPTAFTVTGGGAYCSGGAGVPVGLSGSQTGVNYQLRLNGVNTGAPVSGTGSSISFGNQTAAGTYTVVGTSTTNSCTATMTGSVTITVNSLPTASIAVSETSGATNNDGIICAGASATLTASGGGTYLWNTGSTSAAVSVTPSATTTYTVTVTSTSNCTATATTTITVNPLPSASVAVTETSGATNNDGIICAGSSATLTASGGGTYLWNTGSTSAAVSVTPSATTTYTVTVTTNNCTATATTTITVNPLPSASVAVTETSGAANNDGIICAGASATLTASGGGTYLWNTGSTSAAVGVTPSATTTYTVTVTNTNNCTATATTTITVNPLPSASVSVSETSGATNNDGIICAGASATLTASGGGTYLWNTGSTSAAVSVTPSVTTTYTVTVTTNNCTATATTTITVNPLPSASISVSETSGVSNNDGIIVLGDNATLTASGGSTYLWSTGGTAASITVSPVVTTTYTVTVTSSGGCTSTASTTITVIEQQMVSIAITETSGFTSNDGIICTGSSANLTASGGVSFLWNTGATTASITVSPAVTTTYTVTATDNNGLTASASGVITVNPLPSASVAVTETSGAANNDGIICVGASAILTASGGGTYSWNNGGTVASISVSPSATTTYTVTVTSTGGCTATAVTTVTVNPLPTPSVTVSETSGVTSHDGIICAGASATLTASGGGTYLWNTGSTSAAVSVTPSATTTYTVTVTNTNNCTATATTTITVNPLPSASVAVTETSGATNNDGIICVGSSATLTASGGGTYLWNTGSTSAAVSVTPSATTTYTVTVTNTNNCTATATTTITVNPLPSASVAVTETSGATNNDGIICVGASATLTASGGGTYLWNTGSTSAAVSVTPSVTTTYTVTVTSTGGCTATAVTTVTVNPLPIPSITVSETSGVTSHDGIICAGASATLTASGGGTYLWNTGSTSAAVSVTPSATTTYTVTVTNSNNCTASSTVTITVNPLPSASVAVTETSGATNNDGIICAGASATLTASGGGTYLWNTGSTSAAVSVTPSATTTYTVTVTNSNNCTATATKTITVNPLPSASVAVTETSGATSNDGIICVGASATLTASGGGTYSWNTGSTSAAVSVTPSVTTTYTVTVTSTGGCTATAVTTVTVNPLPIPSITVSETSGVTSHDGIICAGASATLTASGGGTYLWNTGSTSAAVSVTPSATTTYTVTVTNSNNCTASSTVTITVNPLPSASVAVTETSGATNNDGIICVGSSATLTASGGSTYSWNTGSTSAAVSVTPSVTTTYTVTVTNTNNCTATATTTITVNPLPSASVTVTETSGATNNDGIICAGASATLTASGGGTYLWNTGSTSAAVSATPSATTTYTVTVTNTNNCTATATKTITVNPLPSASITVSETSGSGINDGIIEFGDNATLTASGGGTYLWSTGSTVAVITVSPGVTTTYTVTVTNSSNCTATASTTITVNQQQAPAITITESSGVSSNDGIICVGASATLTASGGNTYSWNTGSTSASIVVSPSATTTYTVTVTAVNGTTASVSATVTVNSLPVASISVAETSGITNNDGIICNGANATLTATGGNSYLWSTGSTAASVTVSPSATATYTVTVTNANGCTASTTRTITVNPLPSASVSVSETSGVNNNDGVLCAGAGATLTATGGGSYLWSTGSTSTSISVSPSVTTTYTVTVTSANGCTATAVRIITVNTLPVVSIAVSESSGTSNDGIICNGTSAMLTASGGLSYLWSNGSTPATISVAPSSTTTYTVTATDVNACAGTKSSTITVANPPVLTSLSTVCGVAGTVITINGSNFTGASQVKLNGTVCPTFTVVNPSQLNVTMPFGGSITTASITTACGTGSLQPGVSVSSFTPNSGPAGSLITISGVNLGCLQSVTIGGTPQIILSNTSTSAVIFLMPGTPNGTVTVSSGTGTATSSGIFTVTATPYPYYQQGNKLTGTGATGTAQQGTSVAISADGNTAIIGGPTDNSNAGAAWIYVRNGSTWSQQGSKLVGTGATGAAKQGTSVAISADGNTAVLGGPTDNMGAGAVWVFTRTGSSWSQQGSKLTGSGAVGAAQLGISVSVSADGNTIATGGLGDNSFAGAVWVFTRTGNAWTQQGGKLVGTGATGAARQGCSVSISSDGKTLISGGYNDATRKGAAWVFTQSGGVWTQQGAKLVGSGASADAYQGWSVALSANGNTAAIGGTNDNSLKGAVWIFTRSSGVWSQQGNKLVGTGAVGMARQGSAVAVSADGNTLVEGGYGDNGNKGTMWVFTRSGTSWTQQGSKVTGTGFSGSPKQGTSIALSSTGTTAALGGPTNASNAGATWIFFSSVSLLPTKADTREDEAALVPVDFQLYQNTPNPFTDRTSIRLTLPEPCVAEWQITDMSGRVVLSLKREYPAGDHVEVFDLGGYSGIFWYSLKTPFGVKTLKMIVAE